MGCFWFCLAISLFFHLAVIVLLADGLHIDHEVSGQRQMTAPPLHALVTDAKPHNSPPVPEIFQPGKIDGDANTAPGSYTESPKQAAKRPNLLPIPSNGYFTTDQLSVRPQAVLIPELDTEATKPIIVRGSMILRLWINQRGHVVNVEVEENGLPKIFLDTATDAFRRSRFSPGQKNGIPVGSVMRIEVRYEDQRFSSDLLLPTDSLR
jgi:hypothetical protein